MANFLKGVRKALKGQQQSRKALDTRSPVHNLTDIPLAVNEDLFYPDMSLEEFLEGLLKLTMRVRHLPTTHKLFRARPGEEGSGKWEEG